MGKYGWKAIIYDAEWAVFKKGQNGVFVSEDGKVCETIDDDKSNIIVEADPNVSFALRTNGHILFRQKGTDLFDIVCLSQESGGIYELEAHDVTIDGCEGMDYSTFIESLDVYEIINRTDRRKLSYDDKKNMVSRPNQQDFINNNNYIGYNNGEGGNVIVSIFGKHDTITSSKIIITAVNEPYEQYTGTSINGLENITISHYGTEEGCFLSIVSDAADGCTGGLVKFAKKNAGEQLCTIQPKSGNVAGKCNGGAVTFEAKITQISYPKYIITVNVSISDNYDIMQCGAKIGTTSQTVNEYNVSVIPKDGIEVTQEFSYDTKTIIISASNGVSTMALVITTDKGFRKEIELEIPN